MVAPSVDAAVEECASKAGGTHLFLDPDGQAAKRYNARWLPRAYALDERGNVAYIQPETTLDPVAPLEVEQLWRGSK